MNSTLKCCGCKKRFRAETMTKRPAGWFHSVDCSIAYVRKVQDKAREKIIAKARKDEKEAKKVIRKQHRDDKERIKKRSEWYSDLRSEVHYYVKHIIRKGEPCYTCGKPQSFNDKGAAFHMGHFMPAKQVDPRRFMLENMRIQCYSCNAMKSGNQGEYRKRMVEEMGIDHVEWLECEVNHKPLKVIFPHYEDIKIEIARYRKLIKESK